MSTLALLATKLRAATARERQMLALAAAVLVGGGVLSLLEWSAAERERLLRALPTAEARLARMQEQAEELARLRRAVAPPATPVTVRAEAARAAASARGLHVELESQPEGLLLSGRGAAPAVLDWIAAIQSELGLRAVELELTPDGTALEVAGKLVAVSAEGG